MKRPGRLDRSKPLRAKKALRRGSKRLPPKSAKTAERDEAYGEIRQVFLERHQRCAIRWEGCSTWATDVHHMAGRAPSVFWDQSLWMPACRGCHQLATDHPQRAFDAGVSVRRNQQRE